MTDKILRKGIFTDSIGDKKADLWKLCGEKKFEKVYPVGYYPTGFKV